MPIHQQGRVADGIYVLGHASVPMFLIDGDQPSIIDAGFDCLAPLYLADLKRFLPGRSPRRVLLTHSHFDHVGSVGALLGAYPDLTVAASAHAAEVLQKPNALELISELNRSGCEFAREQWWGAGLEAPPYEPFTPFTVTRIIADGDVVPVGQGRDITVVAAPGHTRDFLCYYLPGPKILFASEAAGTINSTGDYIVTENLVEFDMYLDSLRRLSRLDVDMIFLGHHYHLAGDEARTYLDRSIAQALEFKRWVENLLDEEHGEVENVVRRIRAQEWDTAPLPKQPLPAYMLNLRARVGSIARCHAAPA